MIQQTTQAQGQHWSPPQQPGSLSQQQQQQHQQQQQQQPTGPIKDMIKLIFVQTYKVLLADFPTLPNPTPPNPIPPNPILNPPNPTKYKLTSPNPTLLM